MSIIHCKKAIPSVPSPVKNIRNFLEKTLGKTISAADFFLSFTLAMLCYYQAEEFSTLLIEDKEQIDMLCSDKYALQEWNFKM